VRQVIAIGRGGHAKMVKANGCVAGELGWRPFGRQRLLASLQKFSPSQHVCEFTKLGREMLRCTSA
jgi:hypothetical protein